MIPQLFPNGLIYFNMNKYKENKWIMGNHFSMFKQNPNKITITVLLIGKMDFK